MVSLKFTVTVFPDLVNVDPVRSSVMSGLGLPVSSSVLVPGIFIPYVPLPLALKLIRKFLPLLKFNPENRIKEILSAPSASLALTVYVKFCPCWTQLEGRVNESTIGEDEGFGEGLGLGGGETLQVNE